MKKKLLFILSFSLLALNINAQNDYKILLKSGEFTPQEITPGNKLEISDVDSTLAGEYRVQLKTDEYQCTTDSNSGVSLTVNTPPAPPIVEPIQTFCFTDNPIRILFSYII